MLIFFAVLIFAVALLFLIPSREVTQPPGKLQVVWETLAPGTSPAWGYFGGVVLIIWIYRLIILLDMLFVGPSPYIITAIATPNVQYHYGVPTKDPSEIFRLINPNWVWVYLAPAMLFAVNSFLVFRHKMFRK